jgi:hypothetical protein
MLKYRARFHPTPTTTPDRIPQCFGDSLSEIRKWVVAKLAAAGPQDGAEVVVYEMREVEVGRYVRGSVMKEIAAWEKKGVET